MTIVLPYIQKYPYTPPKCLLSTYCEPGIRAVDSGILVKLMFKEALRCVRHYAFPHIYNTSIPKVKKISKSLNDSRPPESTSKSCCCCPFMHIFST